MSVAERIGDVLRRRLSASEVLVVDESAQHVGHEGAASGGGHFRVTVVSNNFEGHPLLSRHRMVYNALAGEMGRAIHALALTTLTPEQCRAEP